MVLLNRRAEPVHQHLCMVARWLRTLGDAEVQIVGCGRLGLSVEAVLATCYDNSAHTLENIVHMLQNLVRMLGSRFDRLEVEIKACLIWEEMLFLMAIKQMLAAMSADECRSKSTTTRTIGSDRSGGLGEK